MAAPQQMAEAIFLLAENLISNPDVKVGPPTSTPIKHKTPHLESENIRKSILDFTAHFGEINPDMLYLCRRGLLGLKREVFASFPSVRREQMKIIVKSSIFCEKTSKFLSSLPFKA